MKRTVAWLLLCLLILAMLPILPAAAETTEADEVEPVWFKDGSQTFTDEYAFSLAVVGDTQTLTFYGARDLSYGYTNTLPNLYQWIVDNVEAKNIQYVLGLGDITEKGYGDDEKYAGKYVEETCEREWTFAKECITKMDGIVPYSLVRGEGHDGEEPFNRYFSTHTPYTENISGYFREGDVTNVYHTFAVGEQKYMILALDSGIPDDVIEWAGQVIDANPDHKVIITTHMYLDGDGTHLVSGDTHYASSYDKTYNNGDVLWKELFSKHENIFLVMCGHKTNDDVVIKQAKGDNGNTVTQMLIDPQVIDGQVDGGYGMVAMLYFSTDGETVGVEYYSTTKDAYRKLQTFEINHEHEYEGVVTPPACTSSGITTYTCKGCGDSYIDDFVGRLHHDYDDKYDAECNRCGEVRRVPTRPTEATSETEAPIESEPPVESSAPDTESATPPEGSSAPDTESATPPDGGNSTQTEDMTHLDDYGGSKYKSGCSSAAAATEAPTAFFMGGSVAVLAVACSRGRKRRK